MSIRPPRFDAAWQRHQRLARFWRNARWFVLVGVILAAWLAWRIGPWALAGDWEEIDQRVTICGEERAAACMVDGDTLRLGHRRIRLTGYDAPEREGACEAERMLAQAATRAAAQWLSKAPFALDGGADPPRDTYGRELRSARRGDGLAVEWLDDAMVDGGLARRNGWGADDGGWC